MFSYVYKSGVSTVSLLLHFLKGGLLSHPLSSKFMVALRDTDRSVGGVVVIAISSTFSLFVFDISFFIGTINNSQTFSTSCMVYKWNIIDNSKQS